MTIRMQRTDRTVCPKATADDQDAGGAASFTAKSTGNIASGVDDALAKRLAQSTAIAAAALAGDVKAERVATSEGLPPPIVTAAANYNEHVADVANGLSVGLNPGDDQVNSRKSKSMKRDATADTAANDGESGGEPPAKRSKTERRVAHGDDDDRMSCGYDAVGTALELLHLPNPVTSTLIKEFRAVGAARRHLTLAELEKKGVEWPALFAFIKKHVPIVDSEIVGRNLYRGDGAGVDGLVKLGLQNGVYLVGGLSKQHIRLCFVVEVDCDGQGVTIHGKNEVENVAWLHKWLGSVSYVRQVLPRTARS